MVTDSLQLKEKEKIAKNVLRKFGSELGRVNPELTEWVTWHKLRRKGQVCEIDPIIPSPVTDAYRNKCEFTIGKSTFFILVLHSLSIQYLLVLHCLFYLSLLFFIHNHTSNMTSILSTFLIGLHCLNNICK